MRSFGLSERDNSLIHAYQVSDARNTVPINACTRRMVLSRVAWYGPGADLHVFLPIVVLPLGVTRIVYSEGSVLYGYEQ